MEFPPSRTVQASFDASTPPFLLRFLDCKAKERYTSDCCQDYLDGKGSNPKAQDVFVFYMYQI